MRIWHTDLIQVLPRSYLHNLYIDLFILSNRIQSHNIKRREEQFLFNYDLNHFISYAYYVKEELHLRNYKDKNNYWKKIIALKPDYMLLPLNKIFKEKMTEGYKTICFYNLKEQWECGKISLNEWIKIQNHYYNKLKGVNDE